MVVSSVLHSTSVTGVLGVSKSLACSAINNRAVYLNNRNINKMSSLGLASTTSVVLFSNGFYYGGAKGSLYGANAGKAISMNKKKNNKK